MSSSCHHHLPGQGTVPVTLATRRWLLKGTSWTTQDPGHPRRAKCTWVHEAGKGLVGTGERQRRAPESRCHPQAQSTQARTRNAKPCSWKQPPSRSWGLGCRNGATARPQPGEHWGANAPASPSCPPIAVGASLWLSKGRGCYGVRPCPGRSSLPPCCSLCCNLYPQDLLKARLAPRSPGVIFQVNSPVTQRPSTPCPSLTLSQIIPSSSRAALAIEAIVFTVSELPTDTSHLYGCLLHPGLSPPKGQLLSLSC